MKDHYGSLKFKPKKPIDNPYGRVEQPLTYQPHIAVANSVDGALPKDSYQGELIQNRFYDEMQKKELAKKKLAKISAYQKSINELYRPKASDRKR